MTEENTGKTKRDLMWEQKRRMREEKLKSAFAAPQEYNETAVPKFESQSSQPNPEKIISSIENPNPFQSPKEAQNLNFNPFANENAKMPLIDYQRVPPVQDYLNYGNANDLNLPEKKPEPQLNRVLNSNYNSEAIPNNPKIPGNAGLASDPAALNNIMKKEYADFLRNQMREKENGRQNVGGSRKVEKLQEIMESQSYNPFGRPGGGGPNKKVIAIADNHQQYSNQGNFKDNNNHGGNYGGKAQPNEGENMGDYFRRNTYNALVQNNLENLQKEKAKLMNYRNFMNQNAGPSNVPYQQAANPTNYQQDNNYYQQAPSNNYQQDNNYHQQAPSNGYQPQPNSFPQDDYYQNGSKPNQNFPINPNNFPKRFASPPQQSSQYKPQEPQYNNPANNENYYPGQLMNYQETDISQPAGNPHNFKGNPQNYQSLDAEELRKPASIPSMKVRTGRNRLMFENMNEGELAKKEAKAQEMQRALQEQIELKRRQKEMEKERKRQEEAAEEERLRREREEMEAAQRLEEERKRAKFERVRQENLEIREEKNVKKDEPSNFSKDLAENVVKKPMMLRTDVSKEFLEQEGKNSRKNRRKTRNNIMGNQVQGEGQADEGNFENNFNIVGQNNNAGNNPNNGNFGFLNALENGNNNGMLGNDYNNNSSEDVRSTFVRNNDFQARRELEIQNIKNDARSQQKILQQKLNEIQNEAATAIKQKNQAEQELMNLRQMLKEKVQEEENYKKNLLQALSKNDPQAKKKRLLPSQDRSRPILDNIPEPFLHNPQLAEKPQFQVKPLKIFDRGGVTANKEVFQSAVNNGENTLISDTRLVPLDILDHLAKNGSNSPLTLSKIGHLAVRPNSSNVYESEAQNVRKRPFSQKNQRPPSGQSVTSELNREIDTILKAHQAEFQPRPLQNGTFNLAAQDVLQGGIRLENDFPSLTSNNRYEMGNPKESTLHSTLNIEELNKRNEERLKEIELMEQFVSGNGKAPNLRGRNGLNAIVEEDEISKIDKLINNL